jgi:heme-degrading monooxygenase HmoA
MTKKYHKVGQVFYTLPVNRRLKTGCFGLLANIFAATRRFSGMTLVSVTVLHYKPSARFRAFGNMGRVLMQPIAAPGLRFAKLLGSGIDFGMVPDLSRYVFLGVWDDKPSAQTFFQTPTFKQFTDGTTHTETLWLRPLQSHGLWDGQNPFTVNSEQLSVNSEQLSVNSEQLSVNSEQLSVNSEQLSVNSEQLLVNNCTNSLITDNCSLITVLTRATIRPRALPDFWRHVPQARARLRAHENDLLFGIGIGEAPLVQQCTVSVWRNAEAVNQYAYRESGHREVVKLTRQRNWYSEELFARFAVLDWER